MGKCSGNTSTRSMAAIMKLVFDDLGNNVGKAYFTVVIQCYGLSSEIYFLEGENETGSCVVGKRKPKQ